MVINIRQLPIANRQSANIQLDSHKFGSHPQTLTMFSRNLMHIQSRNLSCLCYAIDTCGALSHVLFFTFPSSQRPRSLNRNIHHFHLLLLLLLLLTDSKYIFYSFTFQNIKLLGKPNRISHQGTIGFNKLKHIELPDLNSILES